MNNYFLNNVKEQGVVNIIMNHYNMLTHLERTQKLREQIKKHHHIIRTEFTMNYDKVCSERWYQGKRVTYFYHKLFEDVNNEKLFIITNKKGIGRMLETYLNTTYYEHKAHVSNIRYKIMFNRNIYHDNKC